MLKGLGVVLSVEFHVDQTRLEISKLCQAVGTWSHFGSTVDGCWGLWVGRS